MTQKLEDEFHQAMVNLYHAAAEHGYYATYFLRMVTDYGGLTAARRLLSTPDHQSGLTRLWELRLLDISVEALILQERWENLFSDDERQTARDRLKAYGVEHY